MAVGCPGLTQGAHQAMGRDASPGAAQLAQRRAQSLPCRKPNSVSPSHALRRRTGSILYLLRRYLCRDPNDAGGCDLSCGLCCGPRGGRFPEPRLSTRIRPSYASSPTGEIADRAVEHVVRRQQALAIAEPTEQAELDRPGRQGLGRGDMDPAGQRAVADPLRRSRVRAARLGGDVRRPICRLGPRTPDQRTEQRIRQRSRCHRRSHGQSPQAHCRKFYAGFTPICYSDTAFNVSIPQPPEQLLGAGPLAIHQHVDPADRDLHGGGPTTSTQSICPATPNASSAISAPLRGVTDEVPDAIAIVPSGLVALHV